MIWNLMTGIYGTGQSGWMLDSEGVPRVLREGISPPCGGGHWCTGTLGKQVFNIQYASFPHFDSFYAVLVHIR